MSVTAFIRRVLELGYTIGQALQIAEIFEEHAGQSARLAAEDSDTRRRRLLADAGLSAAQWLERRQQVFERDGEVCGYCETVDGPFHIDHVHPVSRGGSWELDNLRVACATCNRSKKDRTIEEWRGRQ